MLKITSNAVTLIELLIIIVIISIIASITIITVGPLVENTRLNADFATVHQLNASTRLYRIQTPNNDLFTDDTNSSETLLNHLFDNNYIKGHMMPQTKNAYYAWDFNFSQWTLVIDDAVIFVPTNPEHFTVGSPSTFRITLYNLESGTDIVIPSEINGIPITQIGHNALSNLGLTSVILPETIESLAALSLRDNQLTNIALNEGLITIDNNAFQNNQITEIMIPSTVTSVGEHAFDNNPITKITIGEGVTIGNSWSFGIHRPGGGGNFDQVYASQGAGTYLWNGSAWIKQ